MLDPVIEVKELYKYYDGFPAVRGISFTVPRGTVFGLLGPNGAGKTTTIRVLVGLIKPSSGKALIAGYPAGSLEAKSFIGYAPERFSIAGGWRLLDFMVYTGILHGLPRRVAEERGLELLEWVGLGGWEYERFSELSAGMKRRLGLAQALVGDPEILILDEPTEHLDALGRIELLNKIRSLAEAGKTVLVSTHILAEAEMVVDRFAIMHRGRILHQGTMRDLARSSSLVVEVDKPVLLRNLLREKGVEAGLVGNRVVVSPTEGVDADKLVLRLCLEHDVRIKRLEAGGSRLSDFFVKIVEESEDGEQEA